jgi:hypothetical protein
MKNNNTKHNIMKNLTLTILSFFLIHSYSNAAIVYTDVSPDKTLNNSFILIDLNNDGTDDISIDNWSDYANGMAYSEITLQHDKIEIVGLPTPNRTDDGSSSPHGFYVSINSSLNFINNSTITNSNAAIAFKGDGGENYTPWIGLLNKYVGFRIKSSTNQYHYGWIELSFSSEYVLTVHGYAYEDVANTPIITGDRGSTSNSPPTSIALTSSSIDENQPSGSIIGTLASADVNADDAHTYTLISGIGDDDNNSFTISNNELKSNEIFDYETKSFYSIRVKTDDGNGGTYEKQFTININDVNDAPTFLILVNLNGETDNTIDEGEPVGSIVAYIGVADDDEDDEHTFSFVQGTGDDDNDKFILESFALKSNAIFDFETQSIYSIRVKVDDGNGGTYEQQFTVFVNDIHNASLESIGTQSIQVFPNPASSTLHIQGTQPNSTVRLISPTGVVVHEQKNNSSNVIVNISDLSAGLYWLNVSDHNNTMIARMITIE